ncbi:helix-turn-helix transcriptional regulator [Thiomicrorhabdus sp. Milos-T2]|uniref:helix-turn-helix transcriptional regulator n=1 Tax=Thiomicrorhabdus sp. Milos-T2 TaxID=90814 RepID=UPI000494D273|nr:helix-turn-helix transcriptional regulator [Thiomicrorhabdus sp. Milos-T2]
MTYLELGVELVALRKSKSLSQQALADAVGVSRATINALEKGRSIDIGIRKVIKILEYFDQELCFKQKTHFPTFDELKNEQ